MARSKPAPGLFAAQVRAQFLDVLSAVTHVEELRPSGTVMLDTPLTLPNGAFARVAIRRQPGGGFTVSDLGYVARRFVRNDQPGALDGACTAIAEQLSVAWEDGEFRAERTSLREAVWAASLLAIAMVQALTALEWHRAALRKEACGGRDE